MLRAEELHRRGVSAINEGRVRAAGPLLRRALDRATGADLSALIEASLAFVVAELGEPARALEVLARAAERPQLSDHASGVVECQRALILMRRGETPQATAAFARAIERLDEGSEDLGKAHLNRGGIYLQQGRPEEAIADFAAAARHLSRASLGVEVAKAEHNRGYAHFLAGDLVEALHFMDLARPVLGPLSEVSRAIGEQDRAEVLMAAGLVAEGRAALRDSARAYGARRLHRRQAEAELALARTLLIEDPAAAAAMARQASRRFRRGDAEAWRVRADAVALAAEVERGRRSPRLLADGDALTEELTSQGLGWAAVGVRLHTARVLVRGGQHEEAGRRLRAVRLESRSPLAVRLLARDVRADLAASTGRRTDALGQLREGLRELHAWQSSFGSLDLQTRVVGHGTRLAVRGLSLAVDTGRPATLFEWSERARMLASRVTPVRAPEDAELARDLAELRRIARSAGPGRGAATPGESALRLRVRERAWQHRGSGEVSEPCRLADVRAALGADQALVAYVVTARRVVALTVTDVGARVHDLGGRDRLDALLGGLGPDLDVAAGHLPDDIARVVRAELSGRLDDLASVLVRPLSSALGDRQLVLTPSGVLAGVPWSLLPGLHARPVTVAQSATSWLARSARPLRARTAGFVAGPRLARAHDEVVLAAKVWGGAEVVSGSAATAACVAGLAGRVDVLHVAAHGRHSAENPMFSGLELADGPWFGYDIDQLRTVPDVVLLSSCEVGRATVRYGEELIGMTAVWLHAGARCVIASAATVSDEIAHDVLVRVHERLGAGDAPALALAVSLPAPDAGAPPAPFACFG